jgi:hypothetical protein
MSTWTDRGIQAELQTLLFSDLETPEDLEPVAITDEERRSMNEYADDQCSPSYWRGQDVAFKAMCEQLQKALDGEYRAGTCQQPWQALLKRVEVLVQLEDTFTSVMFSR